MWASVVMALICLVSVMIIMRPLVMALIFVLNHLYLVVMAVLTLFFTYFSFQIKNFLWEHVKPVVQIFVQILRVGTTVKDLTREFDILEMKLKDVQEVIKMDEALMKKPTEEVVGWMKRVEALQPSVESITTDYANQRYLRSICSIGLQAVNKLKEVRQEAESIKSVRAYTIAAPPPMVQEVPTTTLAAPCGEIESKLQLALDFLRDDAQKMLGVWGMGGVGKTTLLKHINKALAKDTSFGFDRVVLVTASRGCTVGKIQTSMGKVLGLPGGGDHFTSIYNYLCKKSFLILLDDLWECLDLEEIGIPLPLGVVDGQKRKMILVSRSQQVLHNVGVRRSIKVECLSRDAAWFLFRESVGTEAITSHPRILELASQVADQCGGLPQALITIGRAMAENRSIVSWENAVEDLRNSISNFSESHDITGMKGDPLPLLKFSYDYLKDEKKQQCLLHCSLWPEDCRIPKDELIHCWMGHGLLGEFNNLQEAYRKGHSTIDSLQKASLLEHAESEYYELKDDKVKLHDLIRDMALWIASDCGVNKNKWIVLVGQDLQEAPRDKQLWREAHKISLIFNKIKSLPSEIQSSPNPCSPNLTTLMLQDNKFLDGGLRMCKYFSSLNYLDISRCYNLKCFPTEICGLTKLEYLNISGCVGIRSLPEELKALVNMKYLIARNVHMDSKIPSELLSNLVSLIELDLFMSGDKDFVSSVIDNLDCLEGRLKGLGITVTTISNLQKLVQLSGMPIRSLYLEGMEDFGSSLKLLSHDFLGSQHIRSNLKQVTLSPFRGSVEKVVVEGKHQLNIEKLHLTAATELKEIVWNGVEPRNVFPKLRLLSIVGCHALKSIEWVMYLPCLEDLQLFECVKMEQMFGEEVGAVGTKQEEDRPIFPSLRNLTICRLPNLRSICPQPLTLPHLEYLSITSCAQLKKLPFHSPSSCPKLRVIHCDYATWEGLDLEDDMQAALKPLFR